MKVKTVERGDEDTTVEEGADDEADEGSDADVDIVWQVVYIGGSKEGSKLFGKSEWTRWTVMDKYDGVEATGYLVFVILCVP